MDIFRVPLVGYVISLDHDVKPVLHVARVGQNGLAVGVGVPRFLMDLQTPLGCDSADPAGNFARQMVNLGEEWCYIRQFHLF